MTDVDILIENGTVVTMDPERRVLKTSSVAVSGGKIVDIGPGEELRAKHRATKVIDARRKVVMPGLVDLHSHGGRNLIKGIGEHLPGGPWRNVGDFVCFHTSPEWYYVESLLTSMEKVKSGTTCSLYMAAHGIRGTNPDAAIKNAEAVEKLGLRAVVGVGPNRPPWPREVSEWIGGKRVIRWVTMEETFEGTAEAIRQWKDRQSQKVQMWVSVSRLLNPNPSDPVYDSANDKHIRPQAEGIRRIMEQFSVGFHVHAYGSAVKFADQEQPGLLGPKTVLGHCWPLPVEDVEILARTGTRVAHCPRARRVYSNEGRCPIPEMIDAGVIVALGSDGIGSDHTFDLWEDIFFAPRWQRRLLGNPTLIPPGKALEMATIDGARALGLEDRIGSLEIGKDADIIVVDLFKAHTVPFFMETSRLAHYVRGQDVDTVMVQGEILMEHRQIKNVDENEVLEWAQQQAEETVSLFGLEPLLEPSNMYWRFSHD